MNSTTKFIDSRNVTDLWITHCLQNLSSVEPGDGVASIDGHRYAQRVECFPQLTQTKLGLSVYNSKCMYIQNRVNDKNFITGGSLN